MIDQLDATVRDRLQVGQCQPIVCLPVKQKPA